MPYYASIDSSTKAGKRTLERLLAIRRQLREELPPRSLLDTLLLATWNIRDFDKPSFGGRLPESLFYIAEIISHFDLVAIQEVYKDLAAFKRVMRILGSGWDYIVTDTTGGSRGNNERMAFVFDKHKVNFGGLASELVIAPKGRGKNAKPAEQPWRTPYVCGFTAGWTSFMLATVHIQWGESRANSKSRIKEIETIAAELEKRSKDDYSWSKNVIMLGDFNIFNPKDKTFQALKDHGFKMPNQIASNALRNKYYDQIAFRVRKDRMEWVQEDNNSGAFDFYQVVFTDEDEHLYVPYMPEAYHKKTSGANKGKKKTTKEKSRYYKNWRTHQMSDHLPLWVELKINYTDPYLERRLEEETPKPEKKVEWK